MALGPGQMLLHYRLADKLGEGGMGVVWRAVDTTLDREVAIKVLPEGFATGERLARFEREAKVLASLNHPAIAAVHGLHEDRGVRFLAMEHVPGEDLAQRLVRGRLPVEDAIAIGLQIATGLEAAHESGVVHRDLKPSNVIVRPDGKVKILDFGLAKALAAEGVASGSDPSLSPTMTSAGTLAGMILGTAAYMSPEQARGRAVDRRADIWALGCVLYEMLTGRRLFTGETVSDTLAAVLRAEIDLKELPPSTPERVRRLIARCLDRDPSTRLRDVGEARIALGSNEPAPISTTPPRRSWLPWAVACSVLLVAGFLAGRLLAPKAAPAPTLAFEVDVPGERLETGSIALSPDGSKLALLVRGTDGVTELRVRSLDSFDARSIPGTRGASHPFWSPDGTEIGFFASGHLLRVPLDGTVPQRVGPAPRAAGGTWGRDEVILYGTSRGPIYRTTAKGGGSPIAITQLEKGVEEAHVWPSFLPDGRRFVFLADSSTDDGHRIRLANLDGKSSILLKAIRSAPLVDPRGALLLVKRFQLVAYPFDLARETLDVEPSLVVDGIYPFSQHHDTPVTISSNGVLAHQAGSAASTLVRIELDGGGKTLLLAADRYGSPALSPDGRQIAFELDGSSDERMVWVHDIARGVRTPISQRGALADSGTWSADGSIVYFDANPDGEWKVYRKAATGGGEVECLDRPTDGDTGVLDLSDDGRWLLVNTTSEANAFDLYLKSLDRPDAPWVPWTTGPSSEPQAKFSPDSRWIAYVSDAAGRFEIYVAPTDGGPALRRWQISASGGLEVDWSPDGSQIYYRAPNDELLRVPIRASGDRIEAGAPVAVVALDVPAQSLVRNTFALTPDGSAVVANDAESETRVRIHTSWR